MKKYTTIKKSLKYNLKYALLALFFVLVPVASTHAATIYLDSAESSISVGDTIVVNVKIDADNTPINTVQGNIALSNGSSTVSVQEFSLANSAFGLWPRTPSLSADGKTISFVGGVPGGFNIEGATIFKMILMATKPGSVTISPQGIQVYANDGSGTQLPVTAKNLTIQVSPRAAGTPVLDEWNTILAADQTPPEPFIVVIGQDPSLFNGAKFAYFSAVDNQSGIAYYSVSENGAAPVRTGSTYVLQDQSSNVKLTVTAYDKAGNSTIAYYPAAGTAGGAGGNGANSGGALKGLLWLVIIIAILVAFGRWLMYVRWKNATKNASSSF